MLSYRNRWLWCGVIVVAAGSMAVLPRLAVRAARPQVDGVDRVARRLSAHERRADLYAVRPDDFADQRERRERLPLHSLESRAGRCSESELELTVVDARKDLGANQARAATDHQRRA